MGGRSEGGEIGREEKMEISGLISNPIRVGPNPLVKSKDEGGRVGSWGT